MRQVERIGCVNNGIFITNFSIQWLNSQGSWQTSAWNSGNFDWGEYRASPTLSSIGVPSDAIAVTPYVNAVLGTSNRGAPVVGSANNGRLAAYLVTGTTLNFTVAPLPWRNWAQNVVHMLTVDGECYFLPTNRAELQQIVGNAAKAGATVRVSGQRHSQPPLVAADRRTATSPTSWLVDLSCYSDLGANGDQRMVLDASENKVTVNTGVREDELDAFLTANNLMFKTVTAGGFFSLGGMTAVDVHGATVDTGIFAETVSDFTIMGPDGNVVTINANTPPVNGWLPLQFARVSLGALGIVTSVTVEVLPRPWATTLKPGKATFTCADENAFVSQFKTLTSHTRVESFVNPYTNNYLALWWDVDSNPPPTKNLNETVPDACALTGNEVFGAPYIGPTEPIVELGLIAAQYAGLTSAASAIIDTGYLTIESLFDKAVSVYSDLWLAWASRVIFMSYFVELPALDDAGLSKAWQGLNAAITRLQASQDFLLVAPMEFRFVRGGDTALAGTYTTNPNANFVNLDMIGYVPGVAGSEYPAALLQFFADVERAWVALGGFTHQGKMYGFYDPTEPPGSYSKTGPFNPNFLAYLRTSRGARLQAFNVYRKGVDPNGLFYNEFLRQLLEG
jgi:FAD/FMN-containing dehydrogenase